MIRRRSRKVRTDINEILNSLTSDQTLPCAEEVTKVEEKRQETGPPSPKNSSERANFNLGDNKIQRENTAIVRLYPPKTWSEGKYVKFKTENSPEYKISLDCLNLLQTLKVYYQPNNDAPLLLKPLDVNNRAANSPKFELNNDYILQFIEQYFYEWMPELKKIEHFRDAKVQTGNPTAHLMARDVQLFDDFKQKMWQIYATEMMDKSDTTELVEQKRLAIYIFGTLIYYFREYLDCTMLAKKMAIYIACMLHDSSLEEIEAVCQRPLFTQFVKREEEQFYGEDLADNEGSIVSFRTSQ